MGRPRDLRRENSGISPASGPWSANVGRAVREILEAFASEAVATDVLLNALADGGFEAPPETADDLADFVHGALRAEVTAVLGGEVADAVADGLSPMIGMMRRTEREAAPATPPPARAGQRASRPDVPAIRAHHSPPPVSSPPITSRPATPSQDTLRSASPRPSAERAPTDPGDSPRATSRRDVRPITGIGMTDLAVITADPTLAAELVLRFPGRRVVVGEALGELPRSRVVLVDTRHALDALRITWSASQAPQVAVLWPADARDRAYFEAFQPHVPRVVCAGDEAEIADVVMLVSLQMSPQHP